MYWCLVNDLENTKAVPTGVPSARAHGLYPVPRSFRSLSTPTRSVARLWAASSRWTCRLVVVARRWPGGRPAAPARPRRAERASVIFVLFAMVRSLRFGRDRRGTASPFRGTPRNTRRVTASGSEFREDRRCRTQMPRGLNADCTTAFIARRIERSGARLERPSARSCHTPHIQDALDSAAQVLLWKPSIFIKMKLRSLFLSTPSS